MKNFSGSRPLVPSKFTNFTKHIMFCTLATFHKMRLSQKTKNSGDGPKSVRSADFQDFLKMSTCTHFLGLPTSGRVWLVDPLFPKIFFSYLHFGPFANTVPHGFFL